MSPSRFSAGITSGAPVDASSSAKVASISCGSYGHVRMPRRRGVHLLLEHPLVGRADRVLRPAEDLGAHPLGLAERELGDGAADPPLDPLGAEGHLVLALALAPFLRAVGVADGHPHDRDRRVDAAERHDPGNPPAGTDDHLAADLLAQDPVRRADVVAALRRDRRRLQPQPVLADRARGLVHDPFLVARRCSSERSKRGNSSSIPITSGWSTRSLPRAAPARSRHPRARQSSAAPSAADDTGAVWVSLGDGAQRWMEARGVEGPFPLPRCSRGTRSTIPRRSSGSRCS